MKESINKIIFEQDHKTMEASLMKLINDKGVDNEEILSCINTASKAIGKLYEVKYEEYFKEDINSARSKEKMDALHGMHVQITELLNKLITLENIANRIRYSY